MAGKKATSTKTSKKIKKNSSKSTTKKDSKTKSKKSKNESTEADDLGIVVIEEDFKVDKNAELEARRAYLEEARSQEASSD
jgi:hypothetical protein